MHTQFSRDDRVRLSALVRSGLTQAESAREIGKSASAVSRELNRNRTEEGGYDASIAQRNTQKRRKGAKVEYQKITNDRKLRRHIVRKLKLYWSPEQIAGRLKWNTKKTVICHETIYQWIYISRPDLKKYLRCQKGKYRRKRGTKLKEKERDEAKKRSIDTRPKIVEEKKRLGDWEGDTIIGGEKTQRILTHVERKSGYGVADKLDAVSADLVQQKIIHRFQTLQCHTLTYDNGIEFGQNDAFLEEHLPVQVYRAHPYHSWERGVNENFNGLLRQFFPKKSSFATITQHRVQQAVRLLNHRPRKRLGYLSPHEVFVQRKRCVSN